MSIRSRLAVLVLATSVPALLVCWLTVRTAVESEERAIETRVVEATRLLGKVVDEEMRQQLVRANAIARAIEASAATPGDFHQGARLFRALAVALLEQDQWAAVSSAGVMLLSTRGVATQAELNATVVSRDPPNLTTPDRETTFSPILIDSVSDAWTSRVEVPMPTLRDKAGGVLRLSVTFPAATYQHIIDAQNLPDDWRLAVVDSSAVIAARKPDGARWVGKPVSATLTRHLKAGHTGPFRSVGLDGVETVAFASRSSVTGWAFVIAVPRISYGSVIGRSVSRLYGFAAFLLLASLGVAVWMASKIHRPVTALWRQAVRLQEGRPVKFRDTGGRECNVVSQALAAASRTIEGTRIDLETRVAKALDEAAMARVDGLTGLSNRRHFDELLQREERLSLRKRTVLTLVMIDVDHFKAYNDLYGHLAGDECLKEISRALSLVVHRPGDLLARYGGEEMVFLLPDTDACGAALIAEAARAAVEKLAVPHAASEIGVVSVSVGHASAIVDAPGSGKRLLLQADHALYASKHAGRNQCSMWHDAMLAQQSVRERISTL